MSRLLSLPIVTRTPADATVVTGDTELAGMVMLMDLALSHRMLHMAMLLLSLSMRDVKAAEYAE